MPQMMSAIMIIELRTIDSGKSYNKHLFTVTLNIDFIHQCFVKFKMDLNLMIIRWDM